jgi:hypothetical protein
MKILLIWLIVMVLVILGFETANAKQTQPDPKRVLEIKQALIAHGYEPGKSWPQVQELLRGIAREHGWQTHHAPDARVLILLGLGNKYSDPAVALAGHNHLDGGKDEEKNNELD